MVELTQERLKELLWYNPESGEFLWRQDRGGKAQRGLFAGRKTAKGYIEIGVDGKRYKAHRLAWLYVYGVWPLGQIDHKNRVKDDNWIDNLRDVAQEVNLANTGAQKNNTSGIKFMHKAGNKWRVSIRGKYSKSLPYEEAKELAELVAKEVGYR